MPGDSNSYINYTRKLNAESEALATESRAWLERIQHAQNRDTRSLLLSAMDLPQRIQQNAISLAMHKATEFSSDIPMLFALATQIALVLYGPDSSLLEPYKKDITNQKYDELKQWFMRNDPIEPDIRREAVSDWHLGQI